ncbi:MAG: hypothetical protein AB7I27_16645 [Bacteriovoracaceae bacterium]
MNKSKSLLISVLSLVVFSNVTLADTYRSGTYQDLSKLPGLDQEIFTIAVNSIDRFTMTAQALILQKKINEGQRIKSISEIENGDNSNSPNMKVELINEITGVCTSQLAVVYNGYIDKNGELSDVMMTSVKFVGHPVKCKRI